MAEFKVGDKVDRVAALRAFKMLEGGGPYTVTAVSPSAHFIQINLNTHYGDHYPWDARNFKLIEQDDPLPPAPESVSYYEGTPGGAHLLVEAGWTGLIRIQAKRPGGVTGVVLDPDAALQLAHDLTRMAMEIKRKEKQHG